MRVFTFVVGIVGGFIGVYIWWLFNFSFDEVGIYTEITTYLFLFIPSCFAFFAVLYHKPYMMWLAFLVSLPVDSYSDLSRIPFHAFYYPSILYLLCVLTMTIDQKFKLTPSKNWMYRIFLVPGLLGSLYGFYIGSGYTFIVDPFNSPMGHSDTFFYILFLFFPACFALISSIFQRTELMWVAFLLSIPVLIYFSISDIAYYSVYCPIGFYFLSAILARMGKQGSGKDQQALIKN